MKYHPYGEVVRFRSPQMTGYLPHGALSWGYVYDWDKARTVCRRCSDPLNACKCPPLWALQLGLDRGKPPLQTPHGSRRAVG